MMTATTFRPLFACLFMFAVAASVCAQDNGKADPKPEDKAGHNKAKDVGAAAPDGADVPFDGTMKSVQANFQMWPNADMPITWKLVDDPTSDEKVLMTDGGKRWGTHDL